MGSVRPRSSPMTGLKKEGRNPASAVMRDQKSRAPRSRAYQSTARLRKRSGDQLSGAAGEHEIGFAFANVVVGGVDREHARAAIDLHRVGGHRLAHAQAQRRDARGIGLVREHDDAAEDHFVEGVGLERLAQEQRPPASDREIDWRERAGPATRADERRAAAVDDVNGAAAHAAAVGAGCICDDVSPRENICWLAPRTR